MKPFNNQVDVQTGYSGFFLHLFSTLIAAIVELNKVKTTLPFVYLFVT